MKRIHSALAVIALVSLASCQQEKDIKTTPVGENDIVLTLQGTATTRAAEEVREAATFAFPVAVEGCEDQFFLEETVEDLNAVYAPTKGTPVYTENVGTLYANKLGVYASSFSEKDATYESMDTEMVGGGWRYHHIYNGNPWPGTDTPVDFYLRMPSDMTSKGVSGLSYGKNGENLTISFSYTSPTTTADQQDIIFAAKSLTKTEHDTALPNGVPVLFQHALTGVKFRIANNDELTKGKTGRTQTYITKVTISGLTNSGSCTVTPGAESDIIVWTPEESTGVFSQEYSEAQNLTQYSGSTTTGEGDDAVTTSGSFQNNGNYPDSFSAAGNTYNLNDADASMTFWFIPQYLTAGVKLDVEFHVWDGDKNQATKKLTLKLGEEVLKKEGTNLALAADWKAGQIRTFSLKPLDVNVDITDEMTSYVKSDVKIKNTGNVSEYVRVYLIGNWVGKRLLNADDDPDTISETILMGYTTETGDDEVLRWNDKDFTGSAESPVYQKWTSPGGTQYDYTPYGKFVGLPPMGTSTAGGTMVNDWIRHDKFYYYTKPIGPGENVPDSKPLFSSYTVDEDKIPDFWITDNTGLNRLKAQGVHLVMDIAVQAIEAPMGEDGQPTKTYAEAWAEALGVTVQELNDL